MIHGKTAQKRRRRFFQAVGVLAVVVALVGAGMGVTYAQEGNRQQEAQVVRTAVLNAALQCAAVEGAYPPSLEYLEKHYGLIINKNDYTITYEAFASNVPPSVVVVPK
jgi:hypothetical protein